MKRLLSSLLAITLTAALLIAPAAAAGYTDVPANSTLAGEIQKATNYGLMNGYSATRFGYGDSMTRAQFVTVLGRMLGWFESSAHLAMWLIPDTMSVSQNTLSDTYLYAIEQAAQRDVVDTHMAFRPNDAITRGEMAEMLVRALGLKSAAAMCEKENSLPFKDVSARIGYITVAYEIGMTKGTTPTTFAPNTTATRAQAAAMLVRIYEKINRPTEFTHGFYAISSYSQLELTDTMDAVSAGWSRMTWKDGNTLLSTTSANGNEFYTPSGYGEVVDYLADHGTDLHLCVFMDPSDGVRELLASGDGRTQAVGQIVQELTVNYRALGRNPYSGVTIDFEGLRSTSKLNFVLFLRELSGALKLLDKELYVCVSPEIYGSTYYDGYDYRSIASLSDKLILMAHDYDARQMDGFEGTDYYKTAVPAPVDQVYWGLQSVAKEVGDISKIVLGYSCKNIAWRINQNGKLVSPKPVYPTNSTLATRLTDPNTEIGWSDSYQTSYAIYTDDNGDRYFVYYQNEATVAAARRAARLLGINGISVWRLGTLPNEAHWNWNDLID